MNIKLLFRKYYHIILFTYLLFNVESLLGLILPYYLGKAIDSLLRNNSEGLILYIVIFVIFLCAGTFRRVYDTIFFSKIYANLASDVVLDHHDKDIELSKITARVSLSNKLVEFFEVDIPVILGALYSILGGLIMLYFLNVKIFWYSLACMIPISIINHFFGKRTFRLTEKLNNQIEKGLERISQNKKRNIVTHFLILRKWRIKISNTQAANFSFVTIFVILLMFFSLKTFQGEKLTEGGVIAIFQYLNMFILGIDEVPYLIAQFVTIFDIQRRLKA